MASTVKVRKAIKDQLATVVTAQYYQTAKEKTPARYAVWTLANVNADEILDQAELEIYLIDRGDDTTAIETLADSVWSLFDHWTYYSETDNVGFTTYPSVRNVLAVDDNTIKQRRLTFTVRVYGG